MHIFNPTLIAQFRFGIGRIRNDATPSDYNVNQSQLFGIPGANLGDDWSSGIANIAVTGYDTPMVGYNASLPWVRSQTDFGFAGSVTKIVGNQTVKIGTEINRERMDLDQTQTYSPRGLFTFTAGPTALNGDSASSSGMSRRIPITERIGIDFRFETFNTTNHPHFANPGRTVGTSTFGVVTSTITGDNRGAQIGARLSF
jgi:hypothetical protein